jgi:hypothetical protein
VWIDRTDGSVAAGDGNVGVDGLEGEGVGRSFDKRLASNVSVNILSPITNILKSSFPTLSTVETGSASSVVGKAVAVEGLEVVVSCCLSLILPPSS